MWMMKAREKNQIEDHKLHKWKVQLEVEQRHVEQVMYNEMFEQKKIAYQLKQEVTKKKQKLRDFSSEEKAKRGERRKMLAQRMNLSEEMFKEIEEEDEQKNSLPIIQEKPDRQESKVDVTSNALNLKQRSLSMPTLPSINQEGKNSHVATVMVTVGENKPVSREANIHSAEGDRTDQNSREGNETGANSRASNSKEENTDTDAPKRPKLGRFANLINKVVEQNREEKDAKPKKIKFEAVVDRLFPKAPISQSHNLLAVPSQDTLTRDGEGETNYNPAMDDLVVITDFWVGDPKAIGSVRRARLTPDAMSCREKSISEVRKLLRDMPRYPSCSRNCNRPGAALESIASSMEVFNLPTISKLKKAVSVDVLPVSAETAEQGLLLPDITYASSSFHKKAAQAARDQKQSLRQANKSLMTKFDQAAQSNQFKKKDEIVIDPTKGTRIQIGYAYDPIKNLKKQMEERKQKEIGVELPKTPLPSIAQKQTICGMASLASKMVSITENLSSTPKHKVSPK